MERKKNPNDPISNPVKFFRRGKKKRNNVSLDYLFGRIKAT